VTEAVPTTWSTRRPLLPELALIAATIAYGATFKVVQDALHDVTPVGFILLRFALGAIVLAPFAFRRGWRRQRSDRRGAERGVDPGTWRRVDTAADSAIRLRDFAIACGIFGAVGFAGYWFQNAGLQRTTTSNSAFITGLFVVFTPLLETVVTRRHPARNVLVAVGFAVVGLFLLEGGSFSLGAGDALTLGCAFMFAVWILLGGEFSQRFDPIALTAGQLAVLALLAVPVVAVGGMGHITWQVIGAVIITGVLCSAIAFSLQLWGQRYVEPSRAAVLLQFEPVVAGLVGYAIGERLGVSGYIGALVILAGMFIAESRSWRTA
jgi:drug/metabolite transporter (DMT)-like permease